MQTQSDIKIQIAAAESLTSLCSGSSEQIQSLVDNGIVSAFLFTMKSQNKRLEEYSLCAFSYLAASSVELRDAILQCGIVEEIVKILEGTTDQNVKTNGISTLSSLFKGNPPPESSLVLKGIPLLCHCLQDESTPDILSNVSIALAHLSKNKEIVDCIIDCKVVPSLVKLLSNHYLSVFSACLIIISSIIAGTEEQASVVLQEEELIPALLKLAGNPKMTIRRQVCSIVVNITKGPSSQVEMVVGNSEFVEKLIKMAENEGQDIKKEVTYALVNSTKNCIPAQAIRLLEMGVFECLLGSIGSIYAEELLLTVLDGIGNCLKWGKEFQLVDENGQNKFSVEVARTSVLEKIEALKGSKSKKVNRKVAQIIADYLRYE